ncbi:unnamed protein product [Rhizophagus irregularis]|nr:unnamed protein product [Rhizophagus irregularis]
MNTDQDNPTLLILQKESHRLKTHLKRLMSNSSDEIKEDATQMEGTHTTTAASSCCSPYGLRGHRKYFKDVDSFWQKVERNCAESEAFNFIIQDTTKVFKNSILNVNSSIKKINKTML